MYQKLTLCIVVLYSVFLHKTKWPFAFQVPYCDERVSRAASSTADRNFAVDSAATSKNSCFFCTDHR